MRSKLAMIGAGLLALLVLAVVVVAGAWWTSPRWLPSLAQHYAPRYGIELNALKLNAPRADGVHIERLALTRGNIRLELHQVDIVWERQQVRAGRLQAVRVGRARIRIGKPRVEQPAKPLPDPRTLWSLIPIEHTRIDAFEITIDEPALRAHGRVELSASDLRADVVVDAPAQAKGYRLRGWFKRTGTLHAAVRTAAPEDALVADIRGEWRGAPLTVHADLRAQPTQAQLRALSQLAGVETESGSLALDLRTQFPWPLPAFSDRAAAMSFLRGLQIDGNAEIDWRGTLPNRVRSATLRARAQFSRTPDSVDVQLADGMLLQGELQLDRPLVLFAQSIPTQFSVSGRSALAIRLAGERATVRGRVHAELGDRKTWVRADVRDLDADIDAIANGRYDGLRTRASADIRLEETSFDRLTASATLEANGRGKEVSVRIKPNARLTLGRLGDWTRGTTTARSRRDIALYVQPTSLRWRTGAVRADLTLPNGDFAGNAARFAPAQLRIERTEGSAGTSVDAVGSLDSTISGLDNGLRFAAAGTVRLRGDAVRADIRARVGRTGLPIGFVSNYDLREKRGSLEVVDTLSWTAPLAAGVLERWKEPGDSARGTLGIQLIANYRFVGKQTELHVRGTLAPRDVDATWTDFRLLGLTGRTDFTFADGKLALQNGEAQLREAFVGARIGAVDAGFEFANQVLQARNVSAELLGGKVRTSDFAYGLEGGDAEFEVRLEGIQLAEVLKLQDQALTGDGVLDGTLPLRLRENVAEVRGGSIAARPPGGVIAYAKASEYARNIGQPGFEFALSALSDFHYTRLESSIDYDKTHLLKLGVKLYGHNPSVERGRPINYNLNVTQNIVDLLRSLRATDEVTRRLENKLQQR